MRLSRECERNNISCPSTTSSCPSAFLATSRRAGDAPAPALKKHTGSSPSFPNLLPPPETECPCPRTPKHRSAATPAPAGAEPGTFKDRYYLERDPHRFLEGGLVAAWAVEAQAVYVYLRDEYPFIREILLAEIAKLGPAGLTPHTEIHLRRGAGAYICGEESSMIESIEGKRGLPRHRPPYVAEVGLFGRPTLVQNVETRAMPRWSRERTEEPVREPARCASAEGRPD